MKRWLLAPPVWVALAVISMGCGGGGGSQPPEPNPPAVNTPPVANAGVDQVVAPGVSVTLNGASSSDSNGTIATFAWTQTAGTAVTMASTATATPTFTAPMAPGALTFQLTVTDNGGASHSDSITVTVNAIPVANAGADQTVSAGAAVSLAGSGTDADGSIAGYAWTQTAGPTVTLSNAASATATFTAPAASVTLTFTLGITDDRGATQTDSVTVTVLAIVNPPPDLAPSIAHHPNNPLALENGSAMMFVAASGGGLTYEWRRASGTVVKTGPEPFLLITHLNLSENDDCYYVVVSNTAGIATSEQGCLTVEEIDWRLDPSDDPDSDDDTSYAMGFGTVLFKVAQKITGPFTGRAGGALRLGFPVAFGPPEDCFIGTYKGTTVDGVIVAPGATLPLGHHTLTEAWEDCLTDEDDTSPQTSAYRVEYDFPQTWGVGTLTMHVSDPYVNGTVRASVVALDGNGRSDDIEITIAEDFSAGDLLAAADQTVSVDRRYTSDGQDVDEAYVDFDALFRAYDADGSAGTIGVRQGGFFHLRQHFDDGDSGDPEFMSTGVAVIGLGDYVLATIAPSGTQAGWGFHLLPEEKCPEGYICADPPGP
jgi:hypothetical protein